MSAIIHQLLQSRIIW